MAYWIAGIGLMFGLYCLVMKMAFDYDDDKTDDGL